jgi:4-amino-4-deoxy-L-arabinose transferase-like glycosyltransferase
MVVSRTTARLFLGLIIAGHLVLGTLYAVLTPKWQVPDEPAHYNYVEYVAVRDELPVLEMGDYPSQYLEEIKAARFPSHMSVAAIRYESWQPPLYYSLAAVLYHIAAPLGFDAQFMALRLFSVLLGAAVLWVIYQLVQEICPGQELLALSAAAFAATIPMHLAMTAGISNDTLGELLLTLLIWQSIRIVRQGIQMQRTVTAGILLGLSLLTKTTVYVGAVVLGAAMLLSKPITPRFGARLREKLRPFLGAVMVSLLFGSPWFLRNAMVYGNLDLLAWQRHALVVAGQLRTSEFLSQVGVTGLLRALALTTFRSFWAQFGWMGVLVDGRIYMALALLTGLLALGFVLWLWQLSKAQFADPTKKMSAAAPSSIHGVLLKQCDSVDTSDLSAHGLPAEQVRSWAVLACAGITTLMLYVSYNLSFVQHQGRYLFPALGTISFAAALGLREILRPKTAGTLATFLLLASGLLLFIGALIKDIPVWVLVLLLVGCVGLSAAAWLPLRWRWAVPVVLYLGMLALDGVCLVTFIIPSLAT